MKLTQAIGSFGGILARRAIPALLAALLAATAAAQPVSSPGTAAAETDFLGAVRQDTDWLAGLPSRVPGSPGNQEATEGLLAKIRNILTGGGVPAGELDQTLWTHEFSVVVPRYKRATLTVNAADGAAEHQIYPLWPAMVRLNTTPAGGISGRLVYVWKARHEHLPAISLRGQIAVMEFSGGGGWRHAYNAGATAIILLGFDPDKPHARMAVPTRTGTDELTPGTLASANEHISRLPLNVPRFYVPDGPLAETLRTLTTDSPRVLTGRLDAAGAWEAKTATNLYVVLRSAAGIEQDRLTDVAADGSRASAQRLDALTQLKESLRKHGCQVVGARRDTLYELADASKERDDAVRTAAERLWKEKNQNDGKWYWQRPLTEGRRAIGLAAPYDSMSIVPDLAPGAESAVDAATLLGLLRHFAKNRPMRPMAFLFVDAFSINQRGVREMLKALMIPWLDKTRRRHREDDRILCEKYDRYRDQFDRLTKRGRTPGALAYLAPNTVHKHEFSELHTFMKDEAARAVVAVEAMLHPARLGLAEMRKSIDQQRHFKTGSVKELAAAVEARKQLVARVGEDVAAITEMEIKTEEEKILLAEQQRLARFETLLAEKKYETLTLELAELVVEELARLRSDVLASRQQLITARPVNPRPIRRFLWQRLMDILREQLAEAGTVDRAPESLALWMWDRAKGRIRGQADEARARYDRYWQTDGIQAGMLARLGLLGPLEPPADHEADRRHRPLAFLVGLDLSDAGVAVGPRLYCSFLRYAETGNIKSFRRWLDRYRRDKRLGEIWTEAELAAVNLAPLAGQDYAGSHDVAHVASLTSPALSFATPAVTWATLDALKERRDTPRDRADLLDWGRLSPQVTATLALMRRMVNHDDFKATGNPASKWSRVRAVMVDRSPGEPVPRVPMAGYLSTLVSGLVRGGRTSFKTRYTCAGVRLHEFVFSGRDGRVYFDALPAKAHVDTKTLVLQSYRLAADGSIIRAIDATKVGKGVRLDVNIEETNPSLRRATVFTCRQFNVLDMFDPRFLLHLPSGSVLDARRASKPQRMNMMMYGGNVSCLLEPGTRWQLILRAGTTQNRMTLLGISDVDPKTVDTLSDEMRQGGFELHEQLPQVPMEVSVRDIYRLNERRLNAFRMAGISSKAIEEIHRRTAIVLGESKPTSRPATDAAEPADEPSLDTIEQAKRADDGARLIRAASGALANEVRAYQAVQDNANDVVRAAIFLLLALAPFSFAMERLLFASPHIYKQIGGMASIFFVMTAVLWSFHPAFRLSNQPMMIIMAFGIIFMSLLVIGIVYRRFESSLAELRSGRAESSGAKTSRGGLAASAIRLGIANMRKRKLRTALTGITVVLITFALLCFTSVSSYVGKRELTLDESVQSPYTGILIRQPMGRQMPAEALSYTINVLSSQARRIVPRYWWCHTSEAQWRLHVRHPKTGKQVSLVAGLGLSPGEDELTGVGDYLPDWKEFEAGGGCYLSQDTAEKLGVRPGDTVIVAGRGVKLIGLFSKQDAQGKVAKDFAGDILGMTGEPLAPTDYSRLGEEQRTLVRQLNLDQLAQEMQAGGGLEPDQDLQKVRSDELIILHADMLISGLSNCSLRSIAVQIDDAKGAAEAMADRVAFPVYYGTTGGRTKVLASTPLQAVAPKSLWIVLIIAGLIIFNTMLNSIAERKKEIHIYTSLGLSPMHVGVLFLAEAMTYGLMGAIFGYIVGQGAATLLTNMEWMGGITLNYSGTQAIATMMMVMFIVVVSSLVPAFMAGKLASPSADMKWRVPKPVDGHIRDTLPFTVTRQTANGVAMFLYEYMDAHREGSIGHFSTDNLRTFTAKAAESGEVLGVEGTVWLAPYDLGVRQGVRVLIRPTEEDPDVLEIDVDLTREAGQVGSWQKLNRVFLGDLRRQLLGWRKLKTKRILEYIATGAEVLSRAGGSLEHLPGMMNAMLPGKLPTPPKAKPEAKRDAKAGES